ncbi:hypothetical protein BJX70DRAFT_122143 [Aspergillus crustosus]
MPPNDSQVPSPNHVLVVENNNVVLRIATKLLQKLNCTVACINNGPEALAYLADPGNPRPNLILVKTYSLGSTPDGHEVAQVVRTQPPFIQDPILQATPIIGMIPRSLPGQEHFRRLRYPFLNDFLVKPFRQSDLQWALRVWARRDMRTAKI